MAKNSNLFTKELNAIAEGYNIEPRDALFLQLVAIGADPGDAYRAVYMHGATNNLKTAEQCRTAAKEWISQHPGAALFIQRFKNKLFKNKNNSITDNKIEEGNNIVSEEEAKKFADKSYMIRSLLAASAGMTGKERADILFKVADLQQMKKEENKEREEVRHYYLPYVSNCRTCEILRLFEELTSGKPL
jgi:hypothetical protein